MLGPNKPVFIKWLNPDGTPAHGGTGRWPLPTRNPDGFYTPGAPLTVTGALVPCQHGLHLCRAEDVSHWIAGVPFLVQYRGERIDEPTKIVVREARLVRPLTWTDRERRLFAADCAERALMRYDKAPDPRSLAAVEAARKYAKGKITAQELERAWGRAAGVWRQKWSAHASTYTTYASPFFAAAFVADAAIYATTYAAYAYAPYAAYASAASAVSAADAADAGWLTEKSWQSARLLDYFFGRA